MRPPASGNQCSSICAVAFRFADCAGVSAIFFVSVGNLNLPARLSVIDIASVASMGSWKLGSPFLCLRRSSWSLRESRFRRVRLALFSQQFLQHAHSFVHLLFLQQERRQEAKNCILSDIKQNPFG